MGYCKTAGSYNCLISCNAHQKLDEACLNRFLNVHIAKILINELILPRYLQTILQTNKNMTQLVMTEQKPPKLR